jgi:hypothetical protein
MRRSRALLAHALLAAAVLACLARGCSARWPRLAALRGGRRRHWSPYLPPDLFVPLGGEGSGADVSSQLGATLRFRGRNASRAAVARGGGAARGAAGASAAGASAAGAGDAGGRPPHARGGHHDDNPAGNVYRQLLARHPNGTVKFNRDLNMSLPAPWDIVRRGRQRGPGRRRSWQARSGAGLRQRPRLLSRAGASLQP